MRTTSSRMRLLALFAVMLVALLAFTACGGDDDDDADDAPTATTAAGASSDATATTSEAETEGEATEPAEAEATTAATEAAEATEPAATEPAETEATEEPEATEPAAASPTTSGSGSVGDSLLPEAEGTTAYPLTISTWAGETVLEERPERIAIIGFSPTFDALQALDVTPVYSIADDAEWDWRDPEWYAGIEFVDTATRRDPINFEGIAAADPDLIIAVNFIFDEAEFERLASIAPVLENAEQIAGDQIDWRETQVLIGETLDLGAAAEQVVAEADAAIEALAESRPDFAGKTITMANDYADFPMEYYTVAGGTAEEILMHLGFVPNPLAEQYVEDSAVSDELLSSLDADVLVIFYPEQAKQEARESMPLFQAIPAVAEGRYVPIVFEGGVPGQYGIWVMRRGASALSVPWVLDVIANNWLADVDLSE